MSNTPTLNNAQYLISLIESNLTDLPPIQYYSTRNQAMDNWSQLSAKIVISTYNAPKTGTITHPVKSVIYEKEQVTIDCIFSVDAYGGDIDAISADRENLEAQLYTIGRTLSTSPRVFFVKPSTEKIEAPEKWRLKVETVFHTVIA